MAHQPISDALALGATAPDFTLQGTDGKEYSLIKNRGVKGTVVAFACNHCPYVVAYDERINDLAGEYTSKGITFFVINANDPTNYPEDTFEKMQAKASRMNLQYAYLRDETQKVATAYGAGCTPEFFCFNADLNLVYTGRFDDNMDSPGEVKKHYLRDVINAVLEGKTPSTQTTHPIGCSIKWSK